MNFSAILFDFDGTLGATAADIRRSWLAAIAELQLRCDRFDSAFRVGPSVPETAALLFPDADEAVQRQVATAYKRIYDEAEHYTAAPYPGIVAAVRVLARTAKIFIVTNKRIKPTLKLLNKFGLTELCAGIVTPDIVAPEHPLSKPEMAGLAFRLSGAPLPSRVLMVGDTEIDIAAGRSQGMATCGVTWGYGDPAKLREMRPDYLIGRPEELLDARIQPLA